MRTVSLTLDMKDELARVQVATLSEKQAEVSALVRFAGGLHLIAQRIVIEAEVDSPAVAARLVRYLTSIYGVEPKVVLVKAGSLHRVDRYVIRIVEGAKDLARATGLLDRMGRPIRGLPPAIVAGGRAESLATWRGAFLARGTLVQPGRSSALEVSCPSQEAALALVGAARRLGVSAKAKQVRGGDRVAIRDTEGIASMIELLGAPKTLAQWRSEQERRETRGSINRLANFDDANLRRSAKAAVAASARVQRAFDILGDEVPEHLRAAGMLRVTYREASLEELGRQAQPPLTKDAVAGRIRRLLAMADKAAAQRGIPDTTESLSGENESD